MRSTSGSGRAGKLCREDSFLRDPQEALRACSLGETEDSFMMTDKLSEVEISASMPRKRSCAEFDLEAAATDADLITDPRALMVIKRICSQSDTSTCYISGLDSSSPVPLVFPQQPSSDPASPDSADLAEQMQHTLASPAVSAAAAAAAATAAIAAGGSYILARASEDGSTGTAAAVAGSTRKGAHRLLLLIPRNPAGGSCSNITADQAAQGCIRTSFPASASAPAGNDGTCEAAGLSKVAVTATFNAIKSVPAVKPEPTAPVTAAAAAPAAVPDLSPAALLAADKPEISGKRSCSKRNSSSSGVGHHTSSGSSRKGRQAKNSSGGSSSGSSGALKGPRVRLGGKLLSPEEAERHLKAAAAAAAAAVAARAAATAAAGSSRAASPIDLSIETADTGATAAAATAKPLTISGSMQSGLSDLGTATAAAECPAAAAAYHHQQQVHTPVPLVCEPSAAPNHMLDHGFAAPAAADADATAMPSPFIVPAANVAFKNPAAAPAAAAASISAFTLLGSCTGLGNEPGLIRGDYHSASTNSMQSSAIMIRQHSSRSSSAFNRLSSFNSHNSLSSAATGLGLSQPADISNLASPGSCNTVTFDSYNSVTGSGGGAWGSLSAAAAADDAAGADQDIQQLLCQWAPPPAAAAAVGAPAPVTRTQHHKQRVWRSAFAAPVSGSSVWPQQQQQQVQVQPQLLSTQAEIPKTVQQQQHLMSMVDQLVQERSAQAYSAGYLAAAAAATGSSIVSNSSIKWAQQQATYAVPTSGSLAAPVSCQGWQQQQQQQQLDMMAVDDILPSMQDLLTDCC